MADYYVDHDDGDNANAGTSAGSGNAWLTLEYALETGINIAGPDANGDRVYVNGTGGETLTKKWTMNSWLGNYSESAPLQIIGYSSTTNDQVAEPVITLPADAGVSFIDAGVSYTEWFNLNIVQNNTTSCMYVGTNGGGPQSFRNLHFTRTTNSTGRYFEIIRGSVDLDNCSFVDCGDNYAITTSAQIDIRNCRFVEQDAYTRTVAGGMFKSTTASNKVTASNCLFIVSGASSYCAHGRSNSIFTNCSFHSDSGASSQKGIFGSADDGGQQIVNCIFSGFSGTSSSGILFGSSNRGSSVINCSFYDCTATYTTNSPALAVDIGNETLTVDPFVDADNGDLTPVDAGSVRQGAYPSTMAGGTETYRWRGVIEPKEKLPYHGAAGSLDGI